VVTIVVLALFVPSTSAKKAVKTHKIDMTGNQAIVDMNSERMVCAGSLFGTPIGSGAYLLRTKTNLLHLTGTFVTYGDNGLMRGTADINGEPQPDGSVRFNGKFTITSGTGAYKGAKGAGTATAVLPKGSSITNVVFKGSAKY
jgi:hypothetical protein